MLVVMDYDRQNQNIERSIELIMNYHYLFMYDSPTSNVPEASLLGFQPQARRYIPRSSHLTIGNPARGVERGVEQLRLGTDHHATVAGKLEVRRRRAQVDLADERPGGIPDVDAIAAAGVHVSVRIGVDTCKLFSMSASSWE